MFLRTVIAALFCLVAFARLANASIYYTATTGSNKNPGTMAKPYRTIGYGASKLKPGDILYIRGGVYAENNDGDIPSGSSWSAPVTISAMSGESVTVKPGPGVESVFAFYGPQKYILIKGLRIDGTNTSRDAVKITGSSTGGAANHIELYSCDIFNSYEQGILITDGANYNIIYGTWVHNSALNGQSHEMPLDHYHGIYVATDHNIIQRCTVFHNAGYGIHCFDDSGTSVFNNSVFGNRCYDNGVAGASGAGILLSSGSGNIAYNNLTYGNTIGIAVDYSALGTRVYNNTIYGNRQYGLYVGSGSRGANFTNNLSFHNGWLPDIVNDGSTGSVFNANLAGIDPLFINPTAGDFHLAAHSLAVDKGRPIIDLSVDFDGNVRPRGGGPDIGAFEQ